MADYNFLEVVVPQAWRDEINQVFGKASKILFIENQGFDDSSTQWIFIIETPLTGDQVQEMVFAQGCGSCQVNELEDDGPPCPGCGCCPGQGLTDDCNDPDGCGFWRQEMVDVIDQEMWANR